MKKLLAFPLILLLLALSACASVVGAPRDGQYTVEVTLSGGSGRASVSSPAEITFSGGQATAIIVWSSPNYDYMLVNGTKYTPVNTEGNSAFEIPVLLDADMAVIADTVAMSTPHEIEYTLHFDSATLKPLGSKFLIIAGAAAVILIVVLVGVFAHKGRLRKNGA
jgi:hypothetical protein